MSASNHAGPCPLVPLPTCLPACRYECKEPEPGRFTLAFFRLEDAVRWACHLQAALLHLPWPHELLGYPDCGEVVGQEGQLLWRGLRVRVGMAYGYASCKKPLNTGRAGTARYWP